MFDFSKTVIHLESKGTSEVSITVADGDRSMSIKNGEILESRGFDTQKQANDIRDIFVGVANQCVREDANISYDFGAASKMVFDATLSSGDTLRFLSEAPIDTEEASKRFDSEFQKAIDVVIAAEPGEFSSTVGTIEVSGNKINPEVLNGYVTFIRK